MWCFDLKCKETHTKPKFLLHDGVAGGIFNSGYNGGTTIWRHGTVSSRTLLDLMLARMQRDYEALAPKGRKAGSLKDLDTYLN